jgi:hypothetical protein
MMPDDRSASRPHPLAPALAAFTGVLASGLLGAATYAVNALVSPTYFVTVLGLEDPNTVWQASAAQGMVEGLMLGVLLSLLFTTVMIAITGASSPYRFALKHILHVMAGTLGFWLLGGLTATGLTAMIPDFYDHPFFRLPEELGPMLRYAWVGGSIWGLELGGLISLLLGLVNLHADWYRRVDPLQECPA